MRWIAAISFCILFPLTAGAQYELPGNSLRLDYNSPGASLQMPLLAPLLKPSVTPFALTERDMFVSYNRYQRQSGLTIPEFSINSSMMLVNNRGYMNLYDLGNFNVGLTGSRQTYTSFGMTNSLSLGYGYAPADWITFYGSVYASDNMVHTTRFKDVGVSGKARIKVAERLFVNAYGQYSIYNNAPHSLPMGMYPTTSYGGTIEFKITEKFGIEGGAFREYDPFRREWKTHYYASPVFY